MLFFRFLVVTSVAAQVESQLSLQKKTFSTDINFYVQSKKFQGFTHGLATLISNQVKFLYRYGHKFLSARFLDLLQNISEFSGHKTMIREEVH